jgi:hypothetical protein
MTRRLFTRSSLPLLALAAVAACAEPAAPAPDGSTAMLPKPAGWFPVDGPTGVRSLVVAGGAIYAGDEAGAVHRSADGGQSWAPTAALPDGATAQDLAPDGTGGLLAATDAGVFRTADGSEWTSLGAVDPTGEIGVSAVAADASGRVYAGVSGAEGGVFRRSDDGTWTRTFASPNPRDFIVGFLSPVGDDVVLGTWYDDAWYGAKGDDWRYLGLTGLQGFLPPVQHLVATDRGTLLASSASGIWRSADGGEAWRRAEGGASGSSRLVANPAGGQLIGTTRGYLLRSVDDGRSWKVATRGIGAPIVAVAALPLDEVLVATPSGMWRSWLFPAPVE